MANDEDIKVGDTVQAWLMPWRVWDGKPDLHTPQKRVEWKLFYGIVRSVGKFNVGNEIFFYIEWFERSVQFPKSESSFWCGPPGLDLYYPVE